VEFYGNKHGPGGIISNQHLNYNSLNVKLAVF